VSNLNDFEPRVGIQAGLEPVLLTVDETASLLRISRNLAYELIAQNRLPHIRLGRRILVPRRGLETWIAEEASLPQTSSSVVSFPPQRY
jgi:excisionase family DNA binding protein